MRSFAFLIAIEAIAIKQTSSLGTQPWTLEIVNPKSHSCVPSPGNNPIDAKIVVEVDGDAEAWMREHEGDFICMESWQEDKVRIIICISASRSRKH